MIEAGHRKLVYVYDSDAIYSINLRKEGFYRAVHEAEIPQRDIRVIQNLDARGKTDAERTAKKSLRCGRTVSMEWSFSAIWRHGASLRL